MRTPATIVVPLTLALASVALVGVPAAVGRVDETIKPRAQTIAAGGAHTVVIDGAGEVWGVGSSSDGQLGPVGTVGALRRIPGLPAGVTATAVDAGPDFTVVLGSDGAVYGAGANDFGQLTGSGAADVTNLRPLTGLPGGVKATAVAAGRDFTLVVGSDGTAYGTGRNDRSQLTGAATGRTTLAPLTGLPPGTKATGVDAGADFSVVLDKTGKVHGAGRNTDRQLSLATTSDVTALTPFAAMPSGYVATAVAAGAESTAVLLNDGRIVSTAPGTAPADTGLTGFVAVAADPQGASTLAVRTDGRAYGIGANGSSQLTGPPTTVSTYTALSEPADLDKVVEIAAGAAHTLVRDARGVVYTTGSAAPGVAATTLTQLPEQGFAAPDRPSFLTGATVSEGDVVSANSATWIPSDVGASTFQWERDGSPISGATSATYTVVPADHGSALTVVETRSAAGFVAGSRRSEPVAVAAPTLAAIARAVVSGSGKVGAVLTAKDAVFEPQQEDLSRVWLRNGVQIAGATGSTYRLTAADAGRSISVRNRATKPGALDGASTSSALRVAILATARPRISGTAKVGKRLKVASKGSWHGAASYTYQWYRGSVRIPGATRTSYKVTKKDRRKRLSVRVSARRTGFATVTARSASSRKVR